MFIRTNQMVVAPRALLFDPEFYLFDFSFEQKLTKFLLVDESNLRAAPFVDIRFEPLARGSFLMGTYELLALERQHGLTRPVSSFIFHHAFVCSTLLARCLDQIDAFFSLKEPWILRRLADTKRQLGSKIPRSQWKELFSTYLMLLAKEYASGKSPVIKATNVANNLLPDVLRLSPGHRSLYLFSDLEDFLVSNLKKPADTRERMPGLAKAFVQDEGFAPAFPKYCDIDRLSFLQVCALIWAASLYNFKCIAEKSRSEDVRTLNAETFLDRPGDSLAALAGFFGHAPTTGEISAMTSPEVMATDAKHPQQRHGKDRRARETGQILENHRREIADARTWIDPLVNKLKLPDFMRSMHLTLPAPGRPS